MPSKRTKPASLALLDLIEPTITTTATVFPLHTRHLQLRGNILLISRKPFSATIPSNTHTLPISTTTTIRSLTATTLQLDKHRLTFRTATAQSAFHTALLSARVSRTRYYPISEIGSGASGVVYIVRRDDGQLFAMKTIPKYDAFYSDQHLSRIISERLALGSARAAQSSFIVSLIDAFETDTHLCLVMELASLGDLHTFVTNTSERRLPEGVAKRLFAEALLGLEDLHKMGYLYRDMKLNNLLVTKNGHVRLADFGLAKRVDVEVVDSSVSSTSSDSDDEEEVRVVGRTKSFVGTRRYMSPEHLAVRRGSRGYGAPADVWALGVVLFVMLTGRYPFGNGVSSGDSQRLFQAIKNDELVFPTHVSQQARELLEGMLERDWLERSDIAQIKAHKWLRDIDWADLRKDARNDVPVKEVLQLAGEGIEKQFEDAPDMDCSYCSDCSDSSDDGVCRKAKNRSVQLLGFGFMGYN